MVYYGIDIGSSSIKTAKLFCEKKSIKVDSMNTYEHFNNPSETLKSIIKFIDIKTVKSINATGSLSIITNIPRLPSKYARLKGFNHLYGNNNCTILSLGHKTNSILEVVDNKINSFEENVKCAQGSGNFIEHILNRFDIPTNQPELYNNNDYKPTIFSGRCPVLLKSRITHLHNTGEPKENIIMGLFDALSENILINYNPDPQIKYCLLTGGVSKYLRVREGIQTILKSFSIELLSAHETDNYIDAIGCALAAIEKGNLKSNYENNLFVENFNSWESTPPLYQFKNKVKRLSHHSKINLNGDVINTIIGFDIGSTGTKLLMIKCRTNEIIYSGYVKTNGNPLNAVKELVQDLLQDINKNIRIISCAVTGSGRMLIGSLLRSLFSNASVNIVNEIIAHARGALNYCDSVDTIIEIGGQDSKFISLSNGIITDFALNDACSAGTGSFLEEICIRFLDYHNFENLNQNALKATSGIALGQHCSVFISDVIEKAIASGCNKQTIAVGIFDAIISNYLNRVKKNRPIGKKIFCQGMPFNMEALACAVVHQTGGEVFIPPNPGAVGALGAALLTNSDSFKNKNDDLNIAKILNVNFLKKKTFNCEFNSGCNKRGNQCLIEKITFTKNEKEEEFFWGGNCTLWEKGNSEKLNKKLPNPFYERQELIKSIIINLKYHQISKTIAITDKFHLAELFPFFASFFSELGFNIIHKSNPSERLLSFGKKHSNISMCAPALMHIGEMYSLLDYQPDFLFNPIFINSTNCTMIKEAASCPLLQNSSNIFKNSLKSNRKSKCLSPTIRIGKENLDSPEFFDSCKKITNFLGINTGKMNSAFRIAHETQLKFQSDCYSIGQYAINYCKTNNAVPIVVLGKQYSIHNKFLSSNVSGYLRYLKVVPIPMDCYKVETNGFDINDMYWGFGQYVLLAAQQIKMDKDLFSVFCSNYSCGPDSFLENYYNYIMEGKPSIIIENDGDDGNVGTKMRLEIFLHCVHEYKKNTNNKFPCYHPKIFKKNNFRLSQILNSSDKILLPYIGHASSSVAAALRGSGINCEALPKPDSESLSIGRRFTSGKECLPMSVTLGSLLKYIYKSGFLDKDYKIYFFMPGSDGPCRFGNYHILDRLIIEKLHLQNRVSILSTTDDELLSGMPSSLNAIIYLALICMDNLVACADYVRPIEKERGETNKLFNYYHSIIINRLSHINSFNISNKNIIKEIVTKKIFGFSKLFIDISRDFGVLKTNKKVKTVSLAGALYVRLDSFTNQNLSEKLEAKGLRVKHVPFTEWLDFLNIYDGTNKARPNLTSIINNYLRNRIKVIPNTIIHEGLGVPKFPELKKEIKEISPYIGIDSIGEAILSIGGSIIQNKNSDIDAILNIGPGECLQCKVADSISRNMNTQIITKTIEFDGDPIAPTILEEFVYDIQNQ